MRELTFKTNIKCAGCVSTVSKVLDNNDQIDRWEVDLTNPDRLLRVQTEGLSADEVKDALKSVGYIAEEI